MDINRFSAFYKDDSADNQVKIYIYSEASDEDNPLQVQLLSTKPCIWQHHHLKKMSHFTDHYSPNNTASILEE